MPVNRAKKHYLGHDGFERLNCSLSIVTAFQDELMLKEDYVRSFKAFGGGRAPEGICGAFYAANMLLNSIYPDNIKEFEKYFLEQASSIKCKEIRENKKLSCVGCVEKSSEYLKNINNKLKE